MELTLRDLLTALSILTVWLLSFIGFNSKINKKFICYDKDIESNRKDIEKLSNFFKKVLLDDNGEIRLVDKKTFNAEIKKGDVEHKDINKQLVEVDKKLLLIIIHMGIGEDDTKILKA